MSKIIKILRLRILKKYYGTEKRVPSSRFIGFIPINNLRAIDKNGRVIRFFND